MLNQNSFDHIQDNLLGHILVHFEYAPTDSYKLIHVSYMGKEIIDF